MTVLADRVALVTGASIGIGAGLAAMLAAEGARVVLAARRESELERVADGIRRRGGVAVPVVTDLADDDSLARLLATARAECGPVDVLVNNAGCTRRSWTPPAASSVASQQIAGMPPRPALTERDQVPRHPTDSLVPAARTAASAT